MTIPLVRVGADLSSGGGKWNGPINIETREFAYVAIPESKSVLSGLEKPYASPRLLANLKRFGVTLPEHLRDRNMHLDPDFEHGTYGDQGQRAKQLEKLEKGDMIVFYASLWAHNQNKLVYALIGQITVNRLENVANIADRDMNAHTRREPIAPGDLVVVGDHNASGRYAICVPIGEYRNGAYRVRRDLLNTWGGISTKDGYLQRSARLPMMLDPIRFKQWLVTQGTLLVKRNY